MKENVKDQFESINKIIIANVGTIKELIKQSQGLSDIIGSIGESEENAKLKESLEGTRKKISKSIGELVKQTDELFKAYDLLVDQCFRK